LIHAKGLNLGIHWIEGHSGVPENERCDKLSKEEAMKSNLPADTVYEQEKGLQFF
jgi:ribonuclease HI